MRTPVPGKTRITIRLDDDVTAWFKAQVHAADGGNYQTAINNALKEHIGRQAEPLQATLRRVLREELARSRARSKDGGLRSPARQGTVHKVRNGRSNVDRSVEQTAAMRTPPIKT